MQHRIFDCWQQYNAETDEQLKSEKYYAYWEAIVDAEYWIAVAKDDRQDASEAISEHPQYGAILTVYVADDNHPAPAAIANTQFIKLNSNTLLIDALNHHCGVEICDQHNHTAYLPAEQIEQVIGVTAAKSQPVQKQKTSALHKCFMLLLVIAAVICLGFGISKIISGPKDYHEIQWASLPVELQHQAVTVNLLESYQPVTDQTFVDDESELYLYQSNKRFLKYHLIVLASTDIPAGEQAERYLNRVENEFLDEFGIDVSSSSTHKINQTPIRISHGFTTNLEAKCHATVATIPTAKGYAFVLILSPIQKSDLEEHNYFANKIIDSITVKQPAVMDNAEATADSE